MFHYMCRYEARDVAFLIHTDVLKYKFEMLANYDEIAISYFQI